MERVPASGVDISTGSRIQLVDKICWKDDCIGLLYVSVAVELKANYEQKQVLMRHFGKKPSATSNQELLRGDTIWLGNGEALWLLPAKYKHVVKFSDTNDSHSESGAAATGRKRCADDVGISAELPSKRHSSSLQSTSSDRHNNDVNDKEQDSDTEQVESVCRICLCC